MKRILGIIAIIVTSTFISAANIMGADDTFSNNDQKDECLLVAKNCADNVDSINQRIERLNNELAKGSDVYTTEELRVLKDKLDETVRNLNDIMYTPQMI